MATRLVTRLMSSEYTELTVNAMLPRELAEATRCLLRAPRWILIFVALAVGVAVGISMPGPARDGVVLDPMSRRWQ